MIPKIIHYCWLSNNPVPQKLLDCMDTWKKYMPEFEFILWDTQRFNINSTLWTRQAFNSGKYAFAADYIRLYAVYTCGGIYMDMDVEVLKSLEPLMTKNYILGYEKENGIEGGIFGGEKNAFWLKKCLDYYQDRPFIRPDGTFDIRPLPQIMFECLEDERKFFIIYPNEYLTAKSYETGIITVTENTYTIHHFAGSWHGKKQKLFKTVAKFIGLNAARHISSFLKRINLIK